MEWTLEYAGTKWKNIKYFFFKECCIDNCLLDIIQGFLFTSCYS